MRPTLVMICISVFTTGCIPIPLPGPRAGDEVCQSKVYPPIVMEAIKRHDPHYPYNATNRGERRSSDPLPIAVENENHPDLYMVSKEVIASKKHGWRLNIVYGPPLTRYESDAFLLLEQWHDTLDGLYSFWTSSVSYYLLIDKGSGKVVKRIHQNGSGGWGDHIENNILYLLSNERGVDTPLRVRCISLQ